MTKLLNPQFEAVANTKPLFIVNLLPHNLTVKHDLKMGAGQYLPLSPLDRDSSEVIYAESRGWALVTSEEPTEDNPNSQVIKITAHQPFTGMSEEELRKELAGKVETASGAEKVNMHNPGTTSVAIGKPEAEPAKPAPKAKAAAPAAA